MAAEGEQSQGMAVEGERSQVVADVCRAREGGGGGGQAE